MADVSDTRSATLTALSDCVTTVLANDLAYGLCVTNTGLFDLVPSNFTTLFSEAPIDGTGLTTTAVCRIMCSKQTSSASASCCAATRALQACNTTSSAVGRCKTVIDKVFTFQSECTRRLSSGNATLVASAVLVGLLFGVLAFGSLRATVQKNPFAAKVATTWTQVTNLIWKNILLRRRRPVSLFLELFLPVFLSTALLLLANLDHLAPTWRSSWFTSEAAVLPPNETLVCSGLAIWGLESIGGPSSTMTSFYTGGQSVLGLFFLLSYMKFVSTTTTTMVREKENRLREVMKIMGLSDATLLFSWCLTTAVLATPLAFAIAAELKYGNVFPTTEYATLVLLFWALSCAITAFAYCIAPFFNQSRSAAMASVLLWLLLFFPFFAVQAADTNTPRYWAALSPPTAFALAVDEMLRRAQLGTGFAYSVGRTERPVTVPSAFRMALFLLLDSWLFVALGWYLEQVVPQQYGVTKPWHFLLSDPPWVSGPKHPSIPATSVGSTCDTIATLSPQAAWAYTHLPDAETLAVPMDPVALVEPVHAALALQARHGTCLEICNLRKVFAANAPNERVAVANFSLTMYRGQITALLGHNGAGKTTILSMLTGLVRPTAGNATFNGYSIQREMHELRRLIGICPQHDVLFDELTVTEHLRFFGTMKRVAGTRLATRVDEMIADVGLSDVRHAIVHTLSGGQKRKLSVALAFLGGSTLVFLDEPTSGMDPYSRRFTWNLLQQRRQDRVIVLTTHFMDEADLLGDRIAIVAHGHLRCAGSSLFLKTRFGTGYHLTLVQVAHGTYDAHHMEAFLQTYVPDAQPWRHAGAEVVFQLPATSAHLFPRLFDHLDGQMDQLGVYQYGISVTTLEEVFLRIAHESGRPGDERTHSAASVHSVKPTAEGGTLSPLSAVAAITGPTFWTHYRALAIKRLQLAKRDGKTGAFAVGIPLVFLLLLAVLPEIQVADFIPNYAPSLPTAVQQSHCRASSNVSRLVDPDFNALACTSARGFAYCTLGAVPCDVAVCCDATAVASPWYPCNTCQSALCYNRSCMDKDDAKLQVTLNGYFIALVVLLAFAFIPAAIVSFIVREKDPNQNAKSLQLISGANVAAYWAANWTHDVLVTIIPLAAAALIVPLALPLSGAASASTDETLAIVALVCTHTWVLIPLAYLFARRYDNHAVAQTALLVFALGTGALLSMFSFLCRIVDFRLSSTFTLSSLDRNYLRWLFLLLPGYTLHNGLFELATRKVSRKALFGPETDTPVPSFFGLGHGLGTAPCTECWDRMEPACCIRAPFDLEIAGAPLLYALGEALVLSVLVVYLESRAVTWNATPVRRTNAMAPATEDEEADDDDVQCERQRVDRHDPGPHDLVFIRHLTHHYRGTRRANVAALDDLCLSIPAGECFGYLGINGAGKSTTMAVLTGQLAPTRGFVSLSGLDLSRHAATARPLVGYCPQFDALHDLLTVDEQLSLYARLKGMAEPAVPQAVDAQMQALGLTPYRTVLTQHLSGGNKRKVSTAIALLGRPRVVLLDEPSTGVDPSSRRTMWTAIARQCAAERPYNTAVVLTTHSMEECEALCSRVGILVAGRLQCLGSVAHLKQKFGTGYTVEVALRRVDWASEAVARVRQEVESFLGASHEARDRQRTTRCRTTSCEIPTASVRDLCTALGKPERGPRLLDRSGTKWVLGRQLVAQGAIGSDPFASWWVLETYGEALHAFFQDQFPGTVLVEQQGGHFRFQVPKHRLGTTETLRPAEIFRALEQTRSSLFVDAYSVSETALEHIFNHMAAPQGEEKGVAHRVNVQET